MVKGSGGSDREIIPFISVPLRINPVQSKRHDCQYIRPDRIFRPGRINLTGCNILDIIFIFNIIIGCG